MRNYKRPKICVPIVASFRDAITRQAREASRLPIQMVEWRMDFYGGYEREMAGVIEEIKGNLGDKELIVTLRTEAEGGEPNGSRFDYFSLIEDIRRQGLADYVDIEIMRDEKRLRSVLSDTSGSPTRAIGSYHDFQKTPDKECIVDMLMRAEEHGCDVAKFACMPADTEDVERLLMATAEVKEKRPELALITMSMGETGLCSRLYGGLYGSEVTFGSAFAASAPGQVSYKQLNEVFEKIYGGRKHIILIGFMGVGKSTVSFKLHDLSGMPEIDTDVWIEEREGRTIADIFEQEGEAYFRRKETDMIDELGKLPPSVISCGGGMALRDLNVRKLRAIGEIVLLTAEPEQILERVKGGTARPILNGHMNAEYIRELMEKRRLHYERAADFCVATDGRSVREIAEEILLRFGR